MGEVSPRGSSGAIGGAKGLKRQHHPLPPPQSKEEWDDFITRYSIGEFHLQDFSGQESTDQNTPFPPINQLVEHLRQTGIDNRVSISANLSGSHPASTILTDPTIVPRPSLTSTAVTTESEYEDFHSDMSSAGLCNQDPSIPNIAPEDQRKRKSDRGEQKRKIFKKGSKGQSKEDLNDYRITAEHLMRLNKDQEEAGGQGDAEDRGERERRGSKNGRRRRPQQAQLASATQEASQISSAESIPDKSSARNLARRSPTRQDSGSNLSYRSVRSRSPVESAARSVLTNLVDSVLLESGTGTTSSAASHADSYDHTTERQRLREFYDIHGYLPAPKQTPDATRRRLRVIRRLGLERPDEYHRQALNRFTRLAVSIFKTKVSLVSVIGKDRQILLSEIGFGRDSTDFEVSFCCHTIIGTGEQCMIVPNAAEDWRFRNNPLTAGGQGPVQFYAGAPLRIGRGARAAIIGSMCIIDDKPRIFDEAQRLLLMDLADCVVSELELLYSQQVSVESAKLHQISVDFLRRSLKNRPTERAGLSSSSGHGQTRNMSSTGSSSRNERKEGAGRHQSDDEIDIYDEAARQIRLGLDAYAVSVVDLSQFHLFYPLFQNSSTGASSARGVSTSGTTRSSAPGSRSARMSATGSRTPGSHRPNSPAGSMMTDDTDNYTQSNILRSAKETYAVLDPLAPSRTPQVLFIPSRPRGIKSPQDPDADHQLSVLGYSCAHENFVFNFTSSPAARKIISDFIASNVKTRPVWYTRDDSEAVAQSITHLMPPGTETSMAMPVFGFDGQVAFAIVACWTDPLYTYPSGAMQFVETIAGSLLASVMKEKLHQAERAQLNFAAAASHELRTPLHQINAAASLLRHSLHATMGQVGGQMPVDPTSPTVPNPSPPTLVAVSLEDRVEALAQLEIIEANGLALGHVLENTIDTLDIGSLSTRFDAEVSPRGAAVPAKPRCRTNDFAKVVEDVLKDAIELETISRNVAGVKGMDDVEVILEVLPRVRGQWLIFDDRRPLARALGEIIHNACKFTDKGYVHVTVQDASRDVVLTGGYSNSVKLSTVMIDIKDSGRGMTAEFLEREVLRPFSKADTFMPGSGLGLGLAQRMIEILGGKFAISSTIDRGTLVHVELPLHLINDDNDSDQEELEETDNAELASRPRIPVRQDGIYLAGFDRGELGTRRLGRSLLRQLKLHFCRVVDDIQFAGLVVLPEGIMRDEDVAELASNARPDVEFIYLSSASHPHSANQTSTGPDPSPFPTGATTVTGVLPGIRATRLPRPIGPTAVARIMRPPEQELQTEGGHFVSPIVGGEGAKWNDGGGTCGSGGASDSVSGGGGDSGGTGDRTVGAAARAAARTYARRGSAPGFTYEGDELVLSPPHSSNFRPLDSVSPPEISPKQLDTSNQPDGSLSPSSATPQSQSQATTGGHGRDGHGNGHGHSPRPDRPNMRVMASDLLTAVKPDHSGDQEGSGLRPGMREHRSEMVTASDAEKDSGPLRVFIRVACHYAEAVDGADAVIIFDAFQPDLVLLDINMPVKDGFQAAVEMRQIEQKQGRKRARVIAVTALFGEALRRKGIKASIDSWLVKPVGIKQLKDEVEKMIVKDEEDE